MAQAVDLAVIGGGVVGLAIADAWLARFPRDRVLVLEKEAGLARHASGRNSGVIHSGFYYAPDSLKALLTRDGNTMLRAFCEERAVPVRATGKVVVAQDPGQLSALDELARRGQANGVELEVVSKADLSRLEPLAHTYDRAIWSPTTAVADPVLVVEELARRVTERGGLIETRAAVREAGPGTVIADRLGRLTCGHLVNAAGLYADRVAHWFGVGREYRMLPFKGLYWYANWQPGRLHRHVYPVPDPRNPFLGVHLTVTVDGRVKVGPTAIPALWREDYGGTSGFQLNEFLDIARTYPSFLLSPHHNVPRLLADELPKYSRSWLVRQARKLVPQLQTRDFPTKGRVGVRAQLVNVRDRKLEMDFIVRPGTASTHILNAVSPAWTSSLAVAAHVVDRISDDSDFTRSS